MQAPFFGQPTAELVRQRGRMARPHGPQCRSQPILWLTLCLCITGGLGCNQGEAPRSGRTGGSASPAGTQAVGTRSTTSDAHTTLETWDAVYLGDSKIGYCHTVFATVDRNHETLVKVTSTLDTEIVRFKQRTKSSVHVESLESQAGRVLSFQIETIAGAAPILVSGKVDGDTLHLTTTTQGKQAQQSLPWDSAYRGFFAVEQSLADQPMKEGEQRELMMLMPWLTGVEIVHCTLTAAGIEPVTLLGKTEQLRNITQHVKIGQTVIESTCWTDPQGQILKNVSPQFQQKLIRTTKELAQAKDGGSYDLGTDSVVKIAAPLPHPRQLSKAVYEVSLPSANPARLFVTSASQAVESINDTTARITVVALRPTGQPAVGTDTAPGPGDREPNSLIQSDDPTVMKLAHEAAGTVSGTWEKCVALEAWVDRSMANKNFGSAFATAAEVAQSLQGDCTEHAVLLAALCRAESIPARVAVGLVYWPPGQGFAFHMWTEAWVDDHWVGLDATLGEGGIGADHLKISQSNLQGESASTAMLGVLQVINAAENPGAGVRAAVIGERTASETILERAPDRLESAVHQTKISGLRANTLTESQIRQFPSH